MFNIVFVALVIAAKTVHCFSINFSLDILIVAFEREKNYENFKQLMSILDFMT